MIEMVGFDADDTLWHSEIHFRSAHAEFERIIGTYVDLGDARLHAAMLDTERRNIRLFGYGAKGMTLSMIETAVQITGERISAADIHRLLGLGKAILEHEVELLPGIREAVTEVARDWPVVLITKGDLFHQEAKVRASGMADLFGRIEIVSEKDQATYARLLKEFAVPAERFVMVGNSLRSDIEPVVRLGGFGVHMPYAVTWAHEAEHGLDAGHERVIEVADARAIGAAVHRLAAAAPA
ncbi:MAG TPA: HAD family hydrolase [Pseudomonadales bacterium]|nr:HAD family hydrolase [Pseudomonadales bacterium]